MNSLVFFLQLYWKISIVKWGYQDNFKPVFFSGFFVTKRFRAHKKHQNAKQTTFTLLEVVVRAKNCCFSCLVFAFFLICWLVLVWFSFLYAQNIFMKKNKQAWNCLDNLILVYYWRVPLSTCTPICIHLCLQETSSFWLFLPVRIHFHLVNFFLSVKTYFHFYALLWMLKHCDMNNFWPNHEC